MEQKPKIMNKGNMISATYFAKKRIDDLLKLVEEIKSDSRKQERLDKNECKACFYNSRIGGSAMTYRPCMSCGNNELYSSTATDVLCMECAKNGELCKRCGGDLEMRIKRQNWPEKQLETKE